MLGHSSSAQTCCSTCAASPQGSSAPCPALQVKRIDGIGSAEDSCVVQGVVCNKNLALRRMRTAIDTPRVLLLAGDLEHQRGREKKLLSFDTAIDQVGLLHTYGCLAWLHRRW
jgi:hypothetical protein